MKSDANNDSLMSEINVTPLVDVMLVLLIIFMVTAPMMIHGVDVALPETSAAPIPTGEEERLVISVDRDSHVFINTVEVDLSFLGEKLAAIMEHRKDRQVFLKADKDVPYGFVVSVMAEIKGAGVEKLGMLTQPVETGKKGKEDAEKKIPGTSSPGMIKK
jgi:biopolymer transport protein TolR